VLLTQQCCKIRLQVVELVLVLAQGAGYGENIPMGVDMELVEVVDQEVVAEYYLILGSKACVPC
jgi:hypothetical protein